MRRSRMRAAFMTSLNGVSSCAAMNCEGKTETETERAFWAEEQDRLARYTAKPRPLPLSP